MTNRSLNQWEGWTVGELSFENSIDYDTLKDRYMRFWQTTDCYVFDNVIKELEKMGFIIKDSNLKLIRIK